MKNLSCRFISNIGEIPLKYKVDERYYFQIDKLKLLDLYKVNISSISYSKEKNQIYVCLLNTN